MPWPLGTRRFVFISSIGAVAAVSKPDEPITEEICTPQSDYGRSKKVAEELLRECAHRHNAGLVIIRPPLVHGKGAPGNLARLSSAVRKGVPSPLGSVVNRRSLIDVDNLCKVLLLCVDSDDAPGNTFHVRDLKNYCTQDIVASIARSLSRPIRIFPFPATALRAIATWMGRRDQLEQLTNWLQVHDSHARDLLRYQPEELPIEAA